MSDKYYPGAGLTTSRATTCRTGLVIQKPMTRECYSPQDQHKSASIMFPEKTQVPDVSLNQSLGSSGDLALDTLVYLERSTLETNWLDSARSCGSGALLQEHVLVSSCACLFVCREAASRMTGSTSNYFLKAAAGGSTATIRQHLATPPNCPKADSNA